MAVDLGLRVAGRPGAFYDWSREEQVAALAWDRAMAKKREKEKE